MLPASFIGILKSGPLSDDAAKVAAKVASVRESSHVVEAAMQRRRRCKFSAEKLVISRRSLSATAE